ncbi:NAD-binding protein [Legionella waltersii]|uniref:Adenosylhomocysteinase n=1 Tax=Legionella waltersii TaxID=66969 RepID=A0A0W1ABW6_9GAMM|nr:NAD(P)-dependent oxidoreductase [Legionella waltersii]KTD78809.1 adenosylhomocysteinase [Legionella waltersii]SNV11030.1 adenosylhomocysteinase [Legionella waltersii]
MDVQTKLMQLIQFNEDVFKDSKVMMLNSLRELWLKTQALKGIRILHNIPLTYETLVKLESLQASGADLTVTHTKFIPVSPKSKIIDLLHKLGITYIEHHKDIQGEFDVALDCCAEVLEMNNVQIKKGVVELTQSGGNIYQEANTSFPVINVDDSHLKKLEGMYGTGEAFVRAFKELTGESIENKRFIVFGFGKVGKGIVKYLAKETNNIVVVDSSEDMLKVAKQMGYETVFFSDDEKLKKFCREAFCLVTATGQKHVLSEILNNDDCTHAYVANMGASDEIGPAINHKRVLCNKTPINFSLAHPTRIHFLDPVFYAHNLGAQILLENNLSPGCHAYPSYLDDLIIKLWNKDNPIDINDIYAS